MQNNRRQRVSVIGAGACTDEVYAQARELGAGLASLGVDVVCGGLGGVMQGVCEGARSGGAETIGILPGEDPAAANPYVSVPVCTGLGIMRNWLVVLNGAVVVAVEGEYGTLSELAMARKSGKTVIGLGRWSSVDGVAAARDTAHVLELLRIELNDRQNTHKGS